MISFTCLQSDVKLVVVILTLFYSGVDLNMFFVDVALFRRFKTLVQ